MGPPEGGLTFPLVAQGFTAGYKSFCSVNVCGNFFFAHLQFYIHSLTMLTVPSGTKGLELQFCTGFVFTEIMKTSLVR